MSEYRQILVFPEGAPGDVKELGQLLARLRRERGWKIDDVIAKMAELKRSGGDPSPDLPHPGSLRAVESASRAPSRELAASWFSALGWKSEPSGPLDPSATDELVVTRADDGLCVRLVFGPAARSALLLQSFETVLTERGPDVASINFPAHSGKTAATLSALDQLHRDSEGHTRAVWIVFHRGIARQILDGARRMGLNATKGGGVISLKKAASGRAARDWFVAVGTYWDARNLVAHSAWDSAIPSDGTLLIVDEAQTLDQAGDIVSMVEALATRAQGTIILRSTPSETLNPGTVPSVPAFAHRGLEPEVGTTWGPDASNNEGSAAAPQPAEVNGLDTSLQLETLDRVALVKLATYMAEMLSPTDRLLAKGYLDALGPDTD